MEDYKKKYEQALERAKDIQHHVQGIDIVSKIFPELAESEDEKTRKWIVKELESKYVVDNKVNNIEADKALAWLEKQGEQKKNVMEAWKEMRLEVYAQASGNRHEPNFSDNNSKIFSLNDIDEIFEKVSDCIVEQKLIEWSEEDEVMLKCCINSLELTPEIMERYFVIDGKHITSKELQNWLESLKPNHWKPSKEQMHALEFGIDDVKFCQLGKERVPILESLYNDLQKLM